MEMSTLTIIVIWSITSLLMLVGLLGTIVPGLPGASIIFVGALFYALFTDFKEVDGLVLLVLLILGILSFILDYLGSAYGAKKFGSTRWGIAGAIIGGIIGSIIGNILGLVIGIFLGVSLAEIAFTKKNIKQSLKAGWGGLVGLMTSIIAQFILGLVMVVIFIWSVLI